jgi:hypothetical protein
VGYGFDGVFIVALLVSSVRQLTLGFMLLLALSVKLNLQGQSCLVQVPGVDAHRLRVDSHSQ